MSREPLSSRGPDRGASVRRRRDDRGSSLVLAIIFLTVVSVLMVALVEWVGADLRNTSSFTAAQSFQSTANSAAEIALQNVRYNFMAPTLNASPPAPCWTTSPSPSLLSLNNQSVDAWCSTAWTTGATQSRTVTISVCLSTLSASACAVTPLLQVIVTFGDFERTTGIASCSPVTTAVSSTTTTCGTTMVVDSWAFGSTPPTVASVTDASGTCASGKSFQIKGSNLTGATAVSFVLTTGVSTNQVYPASSFNVASDTTINACTPSVGSGSAYVVVTTPSGSSAFGPTYTY
ncbi:MAG: hypothetical protein KGJ42_08770 [Acidobacteriota bacterium]|nr:hypothetical protein [Acidobacteriota bacterium]